IMHSMTMQETSSSKPFDTSTQELSNESLEKILPEGLVIDRAWLNAQGVSRSSIDYYLRAGRLEAVARGAYRRPGPALKWEHLVYSLQELGYPVHVGGRTALELQGYTHYLSMSGKQQIDLYWGSASGLSEEQIPVLICRDRTGNTADFVLEKADKAHISAVLKPILASDAVLCTDSGKALGAVAWEMGITHRPINLAAGIRVVAKVYHVQNVNAYDSRLKVWMQRFHGVATDYLPNYLGWRRLIDHSHNTLSPNAFLSATLGINYVQQLRVT
ncbi:MAG: IS1595 family transposase, partial [Methylococcaceae bacterium]|nr:IS1595 family transposase [Methylococcaceae bacterium]